MLTKELHGHLERWIAPLRRQVANVAARALVKLVDDSKGMQLVQFEALSDEIIDGAEHYQPYGFCSVPFPGAEGVSVFPLGDRSHPLVVVIADRRYKPKGNAAGTAMLYNHTGARVVILPDGSIEARSASGTATKIPTLADFEALRTAYNTHQHQVATTGTATAQSGTASATTSTVGAPTCTTTFRCE